MSKTILTEEGFQKIQKEIDHIKTIRIPDIEKRLEVAEQVGDEEAIKIINEELDFYTQRIPYLENMQATAKVVKPEFGTYAAHQKEKIKSRQKKLTPLYEISKLLKEANLTRLTFDRDSYDIYKAGDGQIVCRLSSSVDDVVGTVLACAPNWAAMLLEEDQRIMNIVNTCTADNERLRQKLEDRDRTIDKLSADLKKANFMLRFNGIIAGAGE
ncbi:hypothetical protein [Paenibacillus polymyxa]|uniref:hypothetical protein n=1 Tax=Paenibacillus polymyxa TaxID=1406 RepID=UPI00111987DB|nr:hypothetical protein [Paenibacillus polymyxa]QDA30234.1 hypothetical protein FGY93_25275 [Paenibacillus polymyxa]